MSWVATGMAISAGLGAAGGMMTKKGKYEYNPYGQLNPEQIAMTKQLGPEMQRKAMTGAPTYTGDYTADFTPGQQAVLGNQARLSAMSEGWQNQFQPGQINPEVDANEWRNYNQAFYGTGEGGYPGAKALAEEQYAGSGGYWGTPRAQAVTNAYTTNVMNPYQNWRSEALQKSYENALNYATNRSGVNQVTAAMEETPRAIKQYGLDQQYNEWVRGQNMSKEYVDQALSFLGLRTGSAEYKPAEQTTTGKVLSGLGSMGSAYFGNGGTLSGFGGGGGGITGGSGGTTGTASIQGMGVQNYWSPSASQLRAMGY